MHRREACRRPEDRAGRTKFAPAGWGRRAFRSASVGLTGKEIKYDFAEHSLGEPQQEFVDGSAATIHPWSRRSVRQALSSCRRPLPRQREFDVAPAQEMIPGLIRQ